jgi:hypothetical protein
MTTYPLHPLCTLFPRLEGAEFESLREDIKANGQREPIILHDGMVLDGGNRYRACIEAGIEPQVMKFGGGDVVAYVLSANLHRRHLSAGQNAAIVASVTNWAAANKHGGDRKSAQGAKLHFESAADRAAMSGASLRTQKTADKVAKADPALAVSVGQGKTTLAKAAEQVGAKAKPAKPAPASAPSPAAPPQDDEAQQRHDSMAALVEDNDRLSERLALAAMDATDEERAAAQTLINDLKAQLRRLQAENAGLKAMRDALLVESAERLKQIAYWRRQADKARVEA